MDIALAVHGGAWNIPDDEVEDQLRGVHTALHRAWLQLQQGADAVDVVELAVRLLEDDPAFNAGRGSHLNRAGRLQLDASIMEGERLEAGAVAAVTGVRHPVSLARTVMRESPHVLLVADGAMEFARSHGAELCAPEDLLVGRERRRYLRVRDGEQELVDEEFHESEAGDLDAIAREEGDAGGRDPTRPPEGSDSVAGDTVGAVALDRRGNLAAATSTGGTQDKLPGRVGDTPVIGAGTYADDRAGAASATGWGEGILRVVLAKSAVDRMGRGAAPAKAGREALEELGRVEGRAGLTLVAPDGDSAIVFNTPRMARGLATSRGGVRIAVDERWYRPEG